MSNSSSVAQENFDYISKTVFIIETTSCIAPTNGLTATLLRIDNSVSGQLPPGLLGKGKG